jgi:HEAT repeat protein
LAVPLLFEALASPNLLTRQTALKSLAAHQVECESFNPAATPPQRAEQIAALRSRWQTEHPQLAKSNAAETVAAKTAASEDVVRLVQTFEAADDRSTRWLAQRQLEKLGPQAIAALNASVQQREISLKENTYRELLPQLSPTFAQIEKLRQPEVAQRRAAARKLSQAASAEPLPALAIARMDEVAKRETDSLVLTELLRAAAESKDCTAYELAATGLAHEDKDIRRRACEYAALCGDKRQIAALEPLIKDSDPLVVRAAVMALGRCGAPRSRESVHALLGNPDVGMQVLAATALAKWNDPRGPAALERLAKAKYSTTRCQAIGAMAELGSDEFLSTLIEALDDEVSVQIAALAALPKVAGESPLDRIDPKPVSAPDRAQAWKDWYAARESRPAQ